MELVYKKDGFITKLFACLFIALFVVMCVVGNSVFASFDFTYNNENISLPDFPNIEYNNFIICDTSNHNYYYLFLLSSDDKVLDNSRNMLMFAYNSGTIYKIPISSNVNWTKFDDIITSDPTSKYGFNYNYILYTSVDIYDVYDNVAIHANTQTSERGTGSSSDSGGSGNETTGGDTTNTTGGNTSGSGYDSNTQGNTVDNGDDESDNKNFFEKILGWFASIGEFFGTILDHINPLSENFFLKGLLDVLGTGFSYINPLSDNFIFKGFFEAIGNILSFLNPFSENFFGYKIIELLKSALQWLFVPSEERITALHNTISEKFSFVTTIRTASDSIKNSIENTGNAPKLKIRTFKTKYTDEQQQTILDFSFYAPYKAYGDAIITGFVYALFFWRLFISIPNIINGNAGVVSDVDFIRNYNSGKGVK